MLFVKSKVWLSRVRDNGYSLKLGCDCAILFGSQASVEIINKRGNKKQVDQTLSTKTLCLGRVYRMHRKIGNRRIKYQQPLQLTCKTDLPIWKHGYVDVKLRMGQCGPTTWRRVRNHHCIGYNDLCCRNKFV